MKTPHQNATQIGKGARLDPAWSIISGSAIFALGILICGSIATHSPLENSWNVATEVETKNLFGALGATLSDFLLQSFGWAAWLSGFACVVGGISRFAFIARPSFQRWLLTSLSLLAMTSFFAMWPVPKTWPFMTSLGGVVGGNLLGLLALPLKAVLLPYPQMLAALISAIVAVYWIFLIYPRLRYWLYNGIYSLYLTLQRLSVYLARLIGVTASGLAQMQTYVRAPEPISEESWNSRPLGDILQSTAPNVNLGKPAGAANPTAQPNDNILVKLSRSSQSAQDLANRFRQKLGLSKSTLGFSSDAKADEKAALYGHRAESDGIEENADDSLTIPSFLADDTPPTAKPNLNQTDRPANKTSMVNVSRKSAKSTKVIGVPSLSLLDLPKEQRAAIDEAALLNMAERLITVLKDFGVNGKITEIRPGPVVTLFELEPARGVKSARIIALADDIARSIETISARMAVVPGKNAIGIEIPNATRETVYLRSLFESTAYLGNRDRLPMALGEDIGGEPTVVNLAKMPHLLIAGTTGSGKSVGVNAMILSLLFRLPPSECRFIMIDPKMLELSIYEGIPHLLSPVVTDPSKAVNALKWAVMEMESRYELMSKAGVRNLAGFNEKAAKFRTNNETMTREVSTGFDALGEQIIEEEILPTKHIPNIVIIIDEMADLMMVAGKEIEGCVQRLAQMARAAGIHLITATQRPSVDVITGTIKANFPTRISYMVTTKIDSRTILGEQGAEQLLGMGDLLYQAPGKRPRRLHGPFVSDEEVENVVKWLKKQGAPDYIDEILDGPEDGNGSAVMDAILGTPSGDKDEDLYSQAMAIVTQENRASTSYLQRRLKVGYNKAAGLMDRLEEDGVISSANHAGKREIYGKPRDAVIHS